MIYVALLRGINVGGNNKVEMTKLKACFESLGFKDVITYINSGNVVFRSEESTNKEIAQKIEIAIEKDFGFNIRVVVRDISNILILDKSVPKEWTNDDTMKTDIMFLWDEVDSPKVLEQISTKKEIETVRYMAGTVVWNIGRQNVRRSGMKKLIGKDLYKKMTVRNINTVRRIASIMRSLE